MSFVLLAAPCAALVDTRWLTTLKIGRVSDADSLGPPLAMFSPGGGRATLPAWFAADWAASDELRVPLETEFFADALPMVKEEPLRRTAVRSLFTRTTSPDLLDVKTSGAGWGMLSISKIEALLVWCIDLPQGARALLPEGTRLLCSTQAWIGDEVRRLQPLLDELRAELAAMPEGAATQQARRALAARIPALERGLPAPGAPTIEVPGAPGAGGTVTLSTVGQLSVRRTTTKFFKQVAEFGVVGSFDLEPLADASLLESEITTEVDALRDPAGLIEASSF
jgi:hypothetical protein